MIFLEKICPGVKLALSPFTYRSLKGLSIHWQQIHQ